MIPTKAVKALSSTLVTRERKIRPLGQPSYTNAAPAIGALSNPAWFDAAKGFLVVDFTDNTLRATPGARQSILQIGATAGSNAITVTRQTSGKIEVGVSSNSVIVLDVVDANNRVFLSGRMRVGVSYGPGGYHFYINGVRIARLASTVLPTVMTPVCLLCRSAGANPYSAATFNSVSFWPFQPTHEQMAAATAVEPSNTGLNPVSNAFFVLMNAQSNGAGRATGNPVFVHAPKCLKNAMVLEDPVTEPWNYDAAPFFNNGASLYIGDASGTAKVGYMSQVLDILAGGLGKAVYGVPCCKGATNADYWGVDGTAVLANSTPAVYGAGHAVTVQRLKEAVRLFGKKGVYIYHQGEDDAGASLSGTAWKAKVSNTIATVRTIMQDSRFPVVIVGLHKWTNGITATEQNWKAIRAAQMQLAAEMGVHYVDLSDIAGAAGDPAHLAFADFPTVARRVAAQILAAIA